MTAIKSSQSVRKAFNSCKDSGQFKKSFNFATDVINANVCDILKIDLPLFVFQFIIWLCLTRTGNYQIDEFDLLK